MLKTLSKRTEKEKTIGVAGQASANGHGQSNGISYNGDGRACKLCSSKPVETLSGLCWSCRHEVYREWSECCKDRDFDLHLHEYIAQKIAAAGAAQAPVARVGRFAIFANGTIIGPKEYLESEHFAQVLAEIERGRHPVLRAALAAGRSVENAVLVTVVTDYAAWRGTRELVRAGA